MEPLKKPRVSREAREGEIRDAAIRCVLRSGFHATTMDAIAREAGISVGIIYRYFANKEAIIESIVASDIAHLQTAITGIYALSDDQLLEAIVNDSEMILTKQRARTRTSLRLEIYAEAARNPKIEAIVRKFAPMERKALCELLNKSTGGVLAREDLEARADVFRMLADGMLVSGLYDENANHAAMVRAVQKVLRTIVSEPSAAIL